MTPEEKKNLDAIKKIHLDGVAHPLKDRERCYICFLLTLLDQAQRDTERVDKLEKCDVFVQSDSLKLDFSANGNLRELIDRELIDQAALAREKCNCADWGSMGHTSDCPARGEGEK